MFWSNPDDDTSFAPDEASEALLPRICKELFKCGGKMIVVFELVLLFNLSQLY